MPHNTDKRRVVILGGGFGGVYTALHLERTLDPATHEICLVSRHNYFLMTPLLFEAGSGVLEPRHAVSPIRAMLKRSRFIEADVEGVDFDGRVVYARHGPSDRVYELAYDQIVIALGGVTNRRVIPGSEHARGFKTMAEAIDLRNHLIDIFEQADVEEDPARLKELLTFVVIGGGLVGIELVGEMTEFVRQLCQSYPRVNCHPFRFYVFEAGPRVLAEMDPALADYARQTLESRGVSFSTSTPISRISERSVTLPDGREIPAATIMLSAGVTPNPLLADFPLSKDPKGRLRVDSGMRSIDRPEVWAIGDCAAIPDAEGKPYPPLAQHALREAKVLAGNIAASERGEETHAFRYETRGTLASLGGHTGVGEIGGIKVRGMPAWWLWRSYYLMQMPRFDRKLRVLIDWTVEMFFKNDIVKLDLEALPPEVAIEARDRLREQRRR